MDWTLWPDLNGRGLSPATLQVAAFDRLATQRQKWRARKVSNFQHSALRPTFCQLNYAPFDLVEVTGNDPATPCLQGKCSPKLSYTPRPQRTTMR